MRNQIKSILKLALLLILLLLIEMSTLGCFWKPTPQLTSIDPIRGTNNGIVTVTLTGAKFDRKAMVKLTMAGQADIMAQEIKSLSKTQIVASFDLRGKAVGQWDLVVSNTVKKMAKQVHTFTIEYPAPSVIAVSPNQGANNSSLIISSLVGTDFRYGIKVLLRKSDQPEIIASRAALLSNSELTCILDLKNAIPGAYDLVVMNEDGKTGSLANGFTVSLFTPEPASQLKEAALELAVSDEETAVTEEDTVDTEEPAVNLDTAASVEESEEAAGTEDETVVEDTTESEEVTLDEETTETEDETVVEDTTESEEVTLDEEAAETEDEAVVEDTTESEEVTLDEEAAETEDETVVEDTTESEEAVLDLTQAYALQALVNVLEQKGILTKEEVLVELDRIKATMGESEEDVTEGTAESQEVIPEANPE